MSAFIVSDKTIAEIVSFCSRNFNFSSYRFNSASHRSNAHRHFAKYYGEKTGFQEKELANDLIAMNYRAVNARYEEKIEPHLFSGQFTGGQNKFQVLKSAQCLHYQCSEGDVPQEPLFQVLEKFMNDLTSEIIEDLPEYEAAQWNIN